MDGQALERIIALEVPLVQLVVKASPSVSGCSIMHTHEPSTLPAALRPHTLALPFAHPGGPDASMPPFMHPPHGHGPHRSPGRLLQAFLDKLNKWGADNAGEYIKLSSKPHGKRPCPGAMHRAGQRPHSFKYPHGHGPAMLTYDARGNLVTVPSPRPWWGLHRQNAPYKHVSGLRALWRHLGPLAQLGLCFFVTLILSLTPILFIRAIRSANGYSAAQAGGAYARLPNGQALLPPRYEDMTESKLVNYEPTQLTVIVEDVDAEEKAEAGL